VLGSPPPTTEDLTLLFKPEDMTNDAVVMSAIRCMEAAINTDRGLQERWGHIPIVTYNVICLGPKGPREGGLVECVRNAQTVRDIEKDKRWGSLQRWVDSEAGRRGDGARERAFRDGYMKSLAAWVVISYLLGFGDRHKVRACMRACECVCVCVCECVCVLVCVCV
jgi:hypothetical protein